MAITFNVTVNIYDHRHCNEIFKIDKIKRLNLSFSKPVDKTTKVGESMPTIPGTPAAAIMEDNQQLVATITPEDSLGNAVAVPTGDAVVWTSSDITVVTVTPDTTGLTAVCAAVGKVGSVTISVVVNDATGAALATATGTIQVTAAGITQLSIAFGTPSAEAITGAAKKA